MPISEKDIKLLWGRAASICSFPGCRQKLTQDKSVVSGSFPLGEQAHIVGEKEVSPRGKSPLSQDERDSYLNRILLCPTHHKLIDNNQEDYPVEKLHMMKAVHELWVEQQTLHSPSQLSQSTFYADQESANSHLQAFINETKPEEAFLLEASANTIFDPVLKPLIKNRSRIYLLIQNPVTALERFAPSKEEQRRVCNLIARSCEELDVKTCETLRVRFYREIPSLRGRKFDKKLLNVGWLTYDLRDPASEPVHISGHDNPCSSIPAGAQGFDIIEGFFTKVFANLWNNADSPKEICGSCPEKESRLCPATDDWLERVSRA